MFEENRRIGATWSTDAAHDYMYVGVLLLQLLVSSKTLRADRPTAHGEALAWFNESDPELKSLLIIAFMGKDLVGRRAPDAGALGRRREHQAFGRLTSHDDRQTLTAGAGRGNHHRSRADGPAGFPCRRLSRSGRPVSPA